MSRLTISLLAALALGALATAPVLASSGGGAASRIKTNVFIHAMDATSDGAVLKGRVFSKKRPCIRGRAVRIFDFDYRLMATVRSRDNGRFRFRFRDSDFRDYGGKVPPGEYEAKIDRRKKLRSGRVCRQSRYAIYSFRG